MILDVILPKMTGLEVCKLRKKIEDDPSDPRHLITVHRLGYKFVGESPVPTRDK